MTGVGVAAAGLPAGWVRATLGELGVEAQPGFASGKHNRDGDGVVHLRPMNVTRSGVIDLIDARYVQDGTDRRVEFGDVLFNNTNSPALVGKTAWIDSAEPLAYSNHMTRLRAPEGLDGKFLALQLHWLWMSGYFKSVLNNHVNQASVARKALLDTSIVVPPLAEQHRIVAKLNEQITHIETGEAAVESAVEQRQHLEDILLDRVVLGLTDERNSNSLLGIHSKQSRKIDYRELIALPQGWEWRVASDVCTRITSGATPEASLMYSGSGDVPFLKVYNINKRSGVDFTIRPTFVDRETHEGKLKRSRVSPGDVLTNIVGPPLGKTAVVPDEYPEWNINQAIVSFRAGVDIHPEWLGYVLRSPYVIGLLKKTARATAGQFNIALSTCRELPIPVPPRNVQESLCESLAGSLGDFADLFESISLQIGRAAELRSSLLQAAFTGTLVPQNPVDGPALAQLDHVRDGCGAKVADARSPTRKSPVIGSSSYSPVPRKISKQQAVGRQEELPL
ncbi:restriction endonuclease subunit S [Streptomyces sp. NPDC005571]|uniref:restriction endonuclease subunit S n=1 Tax=Streptomyces sp. NPDC005571 TaxID=3156888 RepID=UPI0033B6A659